MKLRFILILYHIIVSKNLISVYTETTLGSDITTNSVISEKKISNNIYGEIGDKYKVIPTSVNDKLESRNKSCQNRNKRLNKHKSKRATDDTIKAKPYNEIAIVHCIDKTSLRIDADMPYTGLYVSAPKGMIFSHNKVDYSMVDGIHNKTNTPLIQMSTNPKTKNFFYPQLFDATTQNIISSSILSDRIVFDNYAYYIKETKSNGQRVLRLVGFNKVWFHCPQSLSLDAQIDAIAVNPTKKWLFRGEYYWDISDGKMESFKVDKALHVKEWDTNLPTNIDASFTDVTNNIYFFKGNSYCVYRNKGNQLHKEKETKEFFGDEFPSDIDATIFVNTNSQLFVFKGEHYWTYIMPKDDRSKPVNNKGPEKVTDLNVLFPTNLNAAVTFGQEVYLFKGWRFTTFSINLLENTTPLKKHEFKYTYIFTGVFKFTAEFYRKELDFPNYAEFIKMYAHRLEEGMTFPETTTLSLWSRPDIGSEFPAPSEQGSTPSRSTSEGAPVLLIIFVIIAILFIILLIIAVIIIALRKDENKIKSHSDKNLIQIYKKKASSPKTESKTESHYNTYRKPVAKDNLPVIPSKFVAEDDEEKSKEVKVYFKLKSADSSRLPSSRSSPKLVNNKFNKKKPKTTPKITKTIRSA